MIRFDPYRLTLGTSPDGDPAAIVYRDTTTDPETDLWALTHTATDAFAVRDEQTDDAALSVTRDHTTRVTNLRVTDDVVGTLHLTGEQTRLSGFDATDEHWLTYDADGSDPILGLERHAVGDYTLRVSRGDTTPRVLTADDDDIDAETLDGHDSTEFLHADGSVALTDWLTVGEYGLSGAAGDIDFRADETVITTGANGERVAIWDATNDADHTSFEPGGDLRVPNGTIRQQGHEVLTTATDVLVAAQNTDGDDLVSEVEAITAGTDLAFTDDGDNTVTLSYAGDYPALSTVGAEATRSGDDEQTTFTLTHDLGVQPASVDVTATSKAASPDFWITDVTATDVTIEYPTAPPAGTDNLSWYVTASGAGESWLDVSVSDDGTQVLSGPDDLNFNGDLTVTDDGDGTVTVGVADHMASTTGAETITGGWQFASSVGVGADTSVMFTNGGGTTQFGLRYESDGDRLVLADDANATDVLGVDRNAVVDFTQTPRVNGSEVATTDDDLANSGSGDAAAESVPVADGDGNTNWERRTDAATVTKSGDASTRVFTLGHDLGREPAAAFVQPTSKAAMSDFRVTNKTATDVVITYHSPPAAGTDNLTYDVITHA